MENQTIVGQQTKVNTQIFDAPEEGARYVAAKIAAFINKRNSEGLPTVLGLATGNTPIPLYMELVRLHKEEGLSFKKVISFNLDEYYPISPDDVNSYHYFMFKHLFSHIDIDRANVHIPVGTLAEHMINEYCEGYERMIREAGGIDIQILGIGRAGHIGFNEPGSQLNDITRLVTLNPLTISDAAGDFGGAEFVPRKALTMGVRTIMEARKVFLLGWGEKKAEILAKAIEGQVGIEVPASFLQKHKDTEFILDKGAASKLACCKY